MAGDERGGTCVNRATLIVFFLPEPLQARLFDLPSRQAGGRAAARGFGAVDRRLGNTCAVGDYAWPPVIALDAQTERVERSEIDSEGRASSAGVCVSHLRLLGAVREARARSVCALQGFEGVGFMRRRLFIADVSLQARKRKKFIR